MVLMGAYDDSIYFHCPECNELIEIDDDLSRLTQCFKCGWNEDDCNCPDCGMGV
jgi:hypothetical protein